MKKYMEMDRMHWVDFLKFLSENKVKHDVNRLPHTALWGVAPTGDIHIGYLQYFGLLRALRQYGIKIICLIGNYHAYLDSQKTEWQQLTNRSSYYKQVFTAFGFKKETIETKNEYLKRSYVEGFLRFSNHISAGNLQRYVKKTLYSSLSKNFKLSDYIYVGTQVFDIGYFKSDLIICGQDESEIYKFGLPSVTDFFKNSRNYMYLPMMPGIVKREMHSSDDKTNKILVHDDFITIREKITHYLKYCKKSNQEPKLIKMLDRFVFPLFGVKTKNYSKYFRNRSYSELSDNVAQSLDDILKPIRLQLKRR